MRLLAPAKINLHLRIGPPDGQGFHPLLTWMVTAGLFDTLVLLRCGTSGDNTGRARFLLATNSPDLPTDERNLVTRAANALAGELERIGEKTTDLCLDSVSGYLFKRIPAGAGLAGGSSDAATALKGLNRVWRGGWSDDRLSELAARLGSDLPFFFHGPSSLCTGRGEIVRPIEPPARARWAVLMPPEIEMPTPAVYRVFDEMSLGRVENVTAEPDFVGWAKLPAKALLERLVNDLEPAAFAIQPALGELRSKLEQSLSRKVRMSGSGSSLFTLCDDFAQGESLARRARETASVRALVVRVAPGIASESAELGAGATQ